MELRQERTRGDWDDHKDHVVEKVEDRAAFFLYDEDPGLAGDRSSLRAPPTAATPPAASQSHAASQPHAASQSHAGGSPSPLLGGATARAFRPISVQRSHSSSPRASRAAMQNGHHSSPVLTKPLNNGVHSNSGVHGNSGGVHGNGQNGHPLEAGGSPVMVARRHTTSDRPSRAPSKSLMSQFSHASDGHSPVVTGGQPSGTPPLTGVSTVGPNDDELVAGGPLLLSDGSGGGFSGQRSKVLLDLMQKSSEGKLFSPLQDKSTFSGTKLSKRESLKVQKKHYRKEKKRAAKELLSTLKDPAVIVMADWMKVRGTLKSWTKLWCVLKPGLLILYKSSKQKSGHWVGTMLLNTCELIERPSKKDGFCFKLFHPLDQSVWATKGPKGENIGAITQPLPYSYLIFRAPSEAAGKCWMDALELALRCSNLLMRTMTRDARDTSLLDQSSSQSGADATFLSPLRTQMNESDCEKHFKGFDEDIRTDREEEEEDKTDSDTERSDDDDEKVFDLDEQPVETPYEENTSEELGQQGEACQTEEVADENKSLIWTLVKQVRPGMDLSKVVLPTFILEPRSLLEKFADYYYHADILSEAVVEDEPYKRMQTVVKWYLSGFYKKPKGLKKPYNPILGETFRCFWRHPKTGSRTFYMAEQISHHPPVSAFYITNRQDGFSISGSVLAKSKFYGNSLSAIMDGGGRLTFLKRGEDYHINMPYAHCKGILIGTLTMELGGKVCIDCEKTGYRAELEFKLKPFLGSGEASNRLVGKIKLGGQTLASLDGHWDTDIMITDKQTGETSMFWSVTPEVKSSRLHRHTVPIDAQEDNESEKLWARVSDAVTAGDQNRATHEKFLLEDAQRRDARERKAKMDDWIPRHFERNDITGDWVYKFADLRPWDAMNDVLQYESSFAIQTKTRHRTPIVRTMSITNITDEGGPGHRPRGGHHTRQASLDHVRAMRIKRASIKRLRALERNESGSSTPDAELLRGDDDDESESSDSAGEELDGAPSSAHKLTRSGLQKALAPLRQTQLDTADRLTTLTNHVTALQRALGPRHAPRHHDDRSHVWTRDFMLLAVMLVFQALLLSVFK